MAAKLTVIVPGFGSGAVPAAKTAAVLRARLAEVQVLVADGRNLAAARNAGVAAAEGEWIAWVDADDVLPDGWFALMHRVAAGEFDAVDAIVFDYEIVRGNVRKPQRWGVSPAAATPADLTRTLLRAKDDFGNYVWNKLFRRRAYTPGFFDEEVGIFEDYLTSARLTAAARSLAYVPEILYDYVQNPVSIVNDDAEGRKSRLVLDLAWRRAEEWATTPYAVDARIGAAVVAYGWLERWRLAHRGYGDEAFARKIETWLRGVTPRLFLARHCKISTRIKLLVALTGAWWVQRLAWRIHGVKSV